MGKRVVNPKELEGKTFEEGKKILEAAGYETQDDKILDYSEPFYESVEFVWNEYILTDEIDDVNTHSITYEENYYYYDTLNHSAAWSPFSTFGTDEEAIVDAKLHDVPSVYRIMKNFGEFYNKNELCSECTLYDTENSFEIASFDTLEKAKQSLKKYKTSICQMSDYGNSKYYHVTEYYIQKLGEIDILECSEMKI